MSRKFFGTDGVRGAVGKAPMTPDFALKLGWATGRVLAGAQGARVLIGKDTRRSGYLFESALEAGLSAAGVEVGLLGPLPTPGVALLTRQLGAQAGVVISASHNPHYDNGVKIFSAEGDKLSDEVEAEIEEWLERELECVPADQLGMVRRVRDAQSQYIDFCVASYRGAPLDGLRIVLDCANGAGYHVAPEVFRRLGADVQSIGVQPNGFNINEQCGSTYLEALRSAVVARGAALGIALDGDGDRCLMVDAAGVPVDGDEILYVIARHRQALGELRGPVVGTLMSNLGLEQAFAAQGIPFLRAKVGDRYVMEQLKAHDGIVGGETSGHTLCLDRATTGDGVLTALEVLAALTATGQDLRALLRDIRKCPQVLINVRIAGRASEVLGGDTVQSGLRAAEAGLAGRGRVLLRASGTEPLIRVMVEAADAGETRRVAERLADCVRLAAQA